MGLSEKLSVGTAVVNEKMREMDERFQELCAFQMHLMQLRLARADEDVGVLTKEKVEKAREEKKEIIYKERKAIINHFAHIHLDENSTAEPPMVPVDATDSKLGIMI
ncbi:hypothetical protein DITRI_Ditri12bG0025600 [Diplodiscus trichospermus]